MADKTTTLKTKTNDNVYPNVIGDNRDNAIVNSAHIKHTLTADHKINFRLDDNVSNLIFNSLQKPKGLTKTELVGVGTNGQENIEIGDNLTLANGKLSASGGGVTPKLAIVYTNKKIKLEISGRTYNAGEIITYSTNAKYSWKEAGCLPPVLISSFTSIDDGSKTHRFSIQLYKFNDYYLGIQLISEEAFTLAQDIYTSDILYQEVHIELTK